MSLNFDSIAAYLPKDNSSSSSSHDDTITSKFYDRKNGKYILEHDLLFLGSAPVFSRYFQAPKLFWDACFCAKMAEDLFCFRFCVLFASFLILTRGQNNRTAFLPSSTSGNSCIVVLDWYLDMTRAFWHDMQLCWVCVILVTFASECPLITFSYIRIHQNVGKLMNAKGIRPLRDTGWGEGYPVVQRLKRLHSYLAFLTNLNLTTH